MIQRSGSSRETRVGSRNFRDNNPGNIEINPKDKHPFAMSHGAIGQEGTPPADVYAVFSDKSTGRAALHTLLRGNRYSALSIGDAMKSFAPAAGGNDPVKYAHALSASVGTPVTTTLGQLNDQQMENFMNAIEHYEGYKAGSVTVTPAGGIR